MAASPNVDDESTANLLFCSRCDNLLYPTTNENRELRWECRACNFMELHDNDKLVYQLELKKEVAASKVSAILAQFAKDPTVFITKEKQCPVCHKNRVAWFINPLEQPIEDLSITFACAECEHVWKDT